ncbi:hypothetical protein B0H14DRAFT_3776863 [Mycena olivaceomarginata]|nr:hypothetical protein B0H14DRAFT_3776863 [Mycena olivaceomarginata]
MKQAKLEREGTGFVEDVNVVGIGAIPIVLLQSLGYGWYRAIKRLRGKPNERPRDQNSSSHIPHPRVLSPRIYSQCRPGGVLLHPGPKERVQHVLSRALRRNLTLAKTQQLFQASAKNKGWILHPIFKPRLVWGRGGYSNSWSLTGFQNFPQLLYYESGTEYDQLSILSDNFTLNYDRLAVQGLPWYAASQLLYKVSRTIYIGAGLTHFLLWHGKGKRVYKLIRAGHEGINDPHFKKMKAYPGETFLHVTSCTNASTKVMSDAAKLLNASLAVMSGAEIATICFYSCTSHSLILALILLSNGFTCLSTHKSHEQLFVHAVRYCIFAEGDQLLGQEAVKKFLELGSVENMFLKAMSYRADREVGVIGCTFLTCFSIGDLGREGGGSGPVRAVGAQCHTAKRDTFLKSNRYKRRQFLRRLRAVINSGRPAPSTQVLLSDKTPGEYAAALQSSQVNRKLVLETKKEAYPAGLDVPGAFKLFWEDMKKPIDGQYIQRGIMILTCLAALMKLLDDTGVTSFETDTTFKPVTIARAYVNGASTEFFERRYNEFQAVKLQVTGKPVAFKRLVEGGNIIAMGSDMEGAQVLGAANSFLKTSDPEYSGISHDTPGEKVAPEIIILCTTHAKR